MEKKDYQILLARKYARGFLYLVCIFYTFLIGVKGYSHLSVSYLIQSVNNTSSKATLGILFQAYFSIYLICLIIGNFPKLAESLFGGSKIIGKRLLKVFLLIGVFGYIDLIIMDQTNISLFRLWIVSYVVFFLYSKWDKVQDKKLTRLYSLYQGKSDLKYLNLKEVKKELKILKKPNVHENYLEINTIIYHIRFSSFHLIVQEENSNLNNYNYNEFNRCIANIFLSCLFFVLAINGMLKEHLFLLYSSVVFMSISLFLAEKNQFICGIKVIWKDIKRVFSD
ncbi:hypothetical protein [Enterococcus faecium]|uniref:hypothetical protein n=1 Tax=Enterococcus faecium TaxID=1352 RepID=UPI0030C847BB